jgi:hypothetical protein
VWGAVAVRPSSSFSRAALPVFSGGIAINQGFLCTPFVYADNIFYGIIISQLNMLEVA